MGIIRGLLGSGFGRRDDPGVVVPVVEVGHRVYVERGPDTVWQHLVSPAPGAELGVDCVRLLPLPGAGPGELPEFAGVWRRSNGRLWVGLSTVVELVPGQRVVARSADGAGSLTLITTLEHLDDGCVVAQQLSGALPSDAAVFARAWLVRGLLGLKADIEGRERRALGDAESDELVERVMVHGVVGPGVLVPGVPSTAAPEFTPVGETATVDVAVTPEQLWEVLAAPTSEQLLKPGLEHLVRVTLADDPGREHVVGVHRRDDGRRGGTVSLVVEAVPPSRIVERELTTSHESDVVTVLEPLGGGTTRLTETFTGWLPSGPGRVVDTSSVAGFMQTRLAIVKNLAEGGAHPQRDPSTGFLPPGQAPDPPPEDPPPTGPQTASPPPVDPPRPKGRGPSVPSSVVLPPPQVPHPAEAYGYRPSFFLGDAVFYIAEDAGWP